MSLRGGGKYLVFTASLPPLLAQRFVFVEMDVVVMELQQSAHLVNVNPRRYLATGPPILRFHARLLLEIIETDTVFISALRVKWDPSS